MKRLVLLAVLMLAPAFALTLPEALTHAADRTGVVNAELTLGDAERGLDRTRIDPLALRFDLVQAEQRYALARSQLIQARYEAFAEVALGYTQMLEADMQVALASSARELAMQGLDIARIRYDRGSATSLDVQDSEIGLRDAEKNLDAAREGLALTRANLEGLIGLTVEELTPVADELVAFELPPLEVFEQGLTLHPTLLQAQQGLELARLGVELLDPSYAARVQIENAELQVEQAQEGLDEAQRGLELQVRSLYNAALTAAESNLIAADSLANARDREALEDRRYDAGLIALFQLNQTRLETLQSELAAAQARHTFLQALFDLQLGSMTPIEGLYGF